MLKKLAIIGISCLLLLTGCNAAPAEQAETVLPTEPPTEILEKMEVTEETKPMDTQKQEIVVYFANWYLDSKSAEEGAEVCSIPWDKVTYVNHAFWAVEPADGSKETSFERREAGESARTNFRVASTLPDADFGNQEPSQMAEGLPRNHFAQYEAYAEKYPDVNVLISIGGWTRCGYFSEMAYTAEGRTSFVNSCMETLEKYPWLDGFDIDWEYFGGSNDGERRPEDNNDQGCPIWGTKQEDSENFALLAQQLRQAMDETYGEGVKKLTACASASYGWTLPNQNWRLVEPYMDLVNIMTYDLAGTWDNITGLASKLSDVKNAVNTMTRGYKVSPAKICIGTPFYGTDYKMTHVPFGKTAVGLQIEPEGPCKGDITQVTLREFESQAVSGYTIDWVDGKPQMGETFDNGGTGWHFIMDETGDAPYMYNDDENSPYYLWYISYENSLSLQQKLDYILENQLAGIIIWECSEDTLDHQMIGQIAENLIQK